MAQRLFDRIIFIAFCEDRRLLPEKTIPKAYTVAGFHAVTNPRWQNFKNLFRFIDAGNETYGIPQYNGGLFAPHAVDELELPDTPWTTFFNAISTYDFADEVNLDVLGHLFERSITELEKLKESGLFGDAEKASQYAAMPQSAKRKQLGIYYTPPELTSRIVQYTVEELIAQRFAAAAVEFGISEKEAQSGHGPRRRRSTGADASAILRNLKIVDPACGSGAFLFQAYDVLEARYNEVIGHLDQLGEAGREETRRTGSDVHSAGEPVRRRSLARGGRDHATGPLDSLGQSGPTARQALGEHRPRQLAGSRPGKSTRPVSIGASGSPTCSTARKPGSIA